MLYTVTVQKAKGLRYVAYAGFDFDRVERYIKRAVKMDLPYFSIGIDGDITRYPFYIYESHGNYFSFTQKPRDFTAKDWSRFTVGSDDKWSLKKDIMGDLDHDHNDRSEAW